MLISLPVFFDILENAAYWLNLNECINLLTKERLNNCQLKKEIKKAEFYLPIQQKLMKICRNGQAP